MVTLALQDGLHGRQHIQFIINYQDFGLDRSCIHHSDVVLFAPGTRVSTCCIGCKDAVSRLYNVVQSQSQRGCLRGEVN